MTILPLRFPSRPLQSSWAERGQEPKASNRQNGFRRLGDSRGRMRPPTGLRLPRSRNLSGGSPISRRRIRPPGAQPASPRPSEPVGAFPRSQRLEVPKNSSAASEAKNPGPNDGRCAWRAFEGAGHGGVGKETHHHSRNGAAHHLTCFLSPAVRWAAPREETVDEVISEQFLRGAFFAAAPTGRPTRPQIRLL